MTALIIVAVVVAYLAFHGGHAHSNYRHGRAHGKRGINLFWSSAVGRRLKSATAGRIYR